eukprot:Sdes_comp20493_c0_seq1m14925
MSVFSKETVRTIAESVGISSLPEEAAAALAPDVEYRVREIIQEACKFMRHSKRKRMETCDINHALRVKNVEPLYGYDSVSTTTSNVSESQPFNALSLLGIKSAASGGFPDVYYVEETEIDLKEFLASPLPKFPADVTFTAHWLAIEGVQPAIPQNIASSAHHSTSTAKLSEGASTLLNDASSAGDSSGRDAMLLQEKNISNYVEMKPVVKHVLSKELQMYYEKLVDVLLTSWSTPSEPSGNLKSAEKSAEQLKEEEKARLIALESLSSDPGLHQLLPYFSQLIADKVVCNLRNLPVLKSLMRMVKALLQNDYLFIEPYLHQIIPAVCTCLVGKRLCSSSGEDHWELRDYSATLIGLICAKYGKSYVSLQSRISKTLLRAFLDSSKPLPTHYGAVKGLAALGNQTVRVVLVPNIKAYGSLLEPIMNCSAKTPLDSQKQSDAKRVYRCLLEAVGQFLA